MSVGDDTRNQIKKNNAEVLILDAASVAAAAENNRELRAALGSLFSELERFWQK